MFSVVYIWSSFCIWSYQELTFATLLGSRASCTWHLEIYFFGDGSDKDHSRVVHHCRVFEEWEPILWMIWLIIPFLERANDVQLDSHKVDQAVTTIMFNVGLVECESCSTSIETMLQKLKGVVSITVSPLHGQVVVKYVSKLVSVSHT